MSEEASESNVEIAPVARSIQVDFKDNREFDSYDVELGLTAYSWNGSYFQVSVKGEGSTFLYIYPADVIRKVTYEFVT